MVFKKNHIANGQQFVENLYSDHKEVYEQLIRSLERERDALIKRIERMEARAQSFDRSS